MLWDFLYKVGEPIFAQWPFSLLREKALKVAMEHIHYEDNNSRYLCVGAGEKVILYIHYECLKNLYLYILSKVLDNFK